MDDRVERAAEAIWRRHQSQFTYGPAVPSVALPQTWGDVSDRQKRKFREQAEDAITAASVPHERSEGEPTERPGAVDPTDLAATDLRIAKDILHRWLIGTVDTDAETEITKAITAARNAGREEMRERAELIALRWRDSAGNDHGIYIGNGIATAIRSLPLQAEGEDTPHG